MPHICLYCNKPVKLSKVERDKIERDNQNHKTINRTYHKKCYKQIKHMCKIINDFNDDDIKNKFNIIMLTRAGYIKDHHYKNYPIVKNLDDCIKNEIWLSTHP